jgi:hypothetical protein
MPDALQFWGPALGFGLIVLGYVAWMLALEKRDP